MADENWLKFDSNNVADTVNNSDNELPLPQGDYDYDVDNIDNNNVDSTDKPSSSRRKIWIGLAIFVVVIGAAVGASFGVLSSPGSSNSNSKQSSSANGANNADNVPVPSPGTYAGNPTLSPGPTASNANEINDIINSIARYGGNEFTPYADNTNTYQYRAKKWVITQNFPIQDGSRMATEQQTTQLYALACIYYATYAVRSDWTDIHYGADVTIPGWFSSRGWLGTGEDVCSNWHGLTCNEGGQIIKIELDTNGLTGSFPPETALLKETLNTIDLYNNIVHNVGELGNAWLGELTNLEYLYLGTTSFEFDGFPSALGQLTALKELDFSYSLYFGDISQSGAAFSKLSNLKYLVMDGNMYNSSLPIELIQLPELEYLYAGYSFLEGGLDFIPSMTNIYELWLDDNPGLEGTIPSAIGNLSNLASFSAANCGLSGSIPSEFGSMTNMIQLWLNDNNLSGEIPSELGNSVTTKILKLHNNQLVGDMPTSICQRRRPFGRLEELGADCDSGNTITCTDDCCTCCGFECGI